MSALSEKALTMEGAAPAVAFAAVTVRKGGRDVLRSIDWRVSADQRWVVIGPNGAGKTTLLDIVAARAHPTTGEAVVLGEQLGAVDVFDLRTRIGAVGPSLAAKIAPTERVRDVVLTAVWAMTGHWRERYEGADIERAAGLLLRFGVDGLADRRIGTLSEGERQRVLIARALMPDPELLVLDEPAAGLDLRAREELVSVLSELADDPRSPAMVLVTHHVEEVPPGFTHGLLLADGETVAAGPLQDVLTGAQLSRTFGLPVTVGRFSGRFFAVAVRT